MILGTAGAPSQSRHSYVENASTWNTPPRRVRGGVFGWAQLTFEIAMQGVGVRNELPEKLGRIDHTKARRARIRVPAGEEAQVDGDPLGRAVEIDVHVQAGALLVRAP